MTATAPHWPTKVATLALPSRETHVAAMVWPSANGSLLLLTELNLALPARHELAAEITDTLSRAWRGRTDTAGGDLEQALEQLVLELNPVLQANERLWGNPLAPRYHLGLALVRGSHLALSTVGHVSAFVVAPDHLTNIAAAAHGARSMARPKPIFSQLIGGEIISSEVLLLATSSLFDYLSPEKLKLLLGGRAPGQGLRELEQVVTALPHHPPLGAIALGLASAAAAEGTQPSMARLLKTKSETSSLLTPTIWTGLRGMFTRTKPTPLGAPPEEPPAAPEIEPQPRQVRSAWGTPLRWYHNLQRFLARLAWLRSRDSVKSTLAWWIEARLAAFRQLPRTKQVALSLAALILLAFCQNLVSSERTRLSARGSERYNELVAQITERQAAIEGALIYHDDDRARTLTGEAEALLQELPHGPASRQQQYQALARGLALLRARLDRRVELTNLEPWARLPDSDTASITTIGSAVYAVKTSGQVIAFNADGNPGPAQAVPKELGKPTAAYSEGANALLRGVGSELATYNPKTPSVTRLSNVPQFKDMAWYEGRLYYLDEKESVIMRTSRTGASLTSPTRWLRASQGTLTAAVSLTVDGAIFVANASSVEKYVQGLKREFTLQQPNPPLQNIELVRTTSESDYLYLVAPRDKRVLVYDKQGKLIVQLVFADVPTLAGIAIDGSNKQLYILGESNIFRLNLADYTN